MKQVSLDALANELAKPGFEKQLTPLLMYKGNQSLGRIQRLWNLSVSMMMHETESLSEAVNHLHLNPEWSHLAMPDRSVQMMSMKSFFSRLRGNPEVTDLVPGFTEYCEWIMPRYFHLDRVSLEASRSRAAWWRTFTPKVPLSERPPEGFADFANDANHRLAEAYGVSEYIIAKWKNYLGVEAYVSGHVRFKLPVPDDFYEVANGKSKLSVMSHYGRGGSVIERWFKETGAEPAAMERATSLSYPFLVHESKRPEHELLRLIDAAIPKHLPPDLRADMCQDLAIGILTGDFNKDDLYLPAKQVAKSVYRMFPTKYGPVSIDAPLTSDSDFSILDTLVDEGRDWA